MVLLCLCPFHDVSCPRVFWPLLPHHSLSHRAWFWMFLYACTLWWFEREMSPISWHLNTYSQLVLFRRCGHARGSTSLGLYTLTRLPVCSFCFIFVMEEARFRLPALTYKLVCYHTSQPWWILTHLEQSACIINPSFHKLPWSTWFNIAAEKSVMQTYILGHTLFTPSDIIYGLKTHHFFPPSQLSLHIHT